MGIHTSAILIQGELDGDHNEIIRDLCPLPGLQVHEVSRKFSEISWNDSGCLAIGKIDGWTVIWGILSLHDWAFEKMLVSKERTVLDGTLEFAFPLLRQLSQGRKVLAWIIEETSATYGFDWFVNGERQRSYWEAENEILRNEGNILDCEKEILSQSGEEYDSNVILNIMEQLTISQEQIRPEALQVYHLISPAPEGKDRKSVYLRIFLTGAFFLCGFGFLTVWLSRNGFSFWSIPTGYLTIVGIQHFVGWITGKHRWLRNVK